MKAISPTPAGKFLEDNHIQIYGWVNPGFNISTAHSLPGSLSGGNNPVAYSYQPNILQLDQFVDDHRARAGRGAEGPVGLGLPTFAALRRNLSLHDCFRHIKLPAAEVEQVRGL